MNHRHVHKRKHRNALKYYFYIAMSILILIVIVLYYSTYRAGQTSENGYGLDYFSELNKDVGNSLGEVFANSQIISTELILGYVQGIQPYEIIIGRKIRGPMDGFCLLWNSLYIQSKNRFEDDLSWEEFENEDITESDSNTNGMTASNSNMDQTDNFSRMFGQEGIDCTCVLSKEALQELGGIGMYAVGGANNVDFSGGANNIIYLGGILDPISLTQNKLEDHTEVDQKQIPNEGNQPLPVPEPSTMLLTGSGLILLFRRIRKSVVGSWKRI